MHVLNLHAIICIVRRRICSHSPRAEKAFSQSRQAQELPLAVMCLLDQPIKNTGGFKDRFGRGSIPTSSNLCFPMG